MVSFYLRERTGWTLVADADEETWRWERPESASYPAARVDVRPLDVTRREMGEEHAQWRTAHTVISAIAWVERRPDVHVYASLLPERGPWSTP